MDDLDDVLSELEADGDDDELEADGDDFESALELVADGDFESELELVAAGDEGEPDVAEDDGDEGEVADGEVLVSLCFDLSSARALVAMNKLPTSVAMMVRFI